MSRIPPASAARLPGGPAADRSAPASPAGAVPSARTALLAVAGLVVAAVLSGCAASPRPSPLPALTTAAAPAASDTGAPAVQPAAAQPTEARPTEAQPTPSGPGTTVSLASVGRLGPILVDQQGRTLYLYDADNSVHSTCVNGCAESWPAVTTTGDPVAGQGVDEGLLGAAARPDGTVQVLYKGHPLYRFSGDRTPGDTNGQAVQDFAGFWYTVNALGDRVPGAIGGGGSALGPQDSPADEAQDG